MCHIIILENVIIFYLFQIIPDVYGEEGGVVEEK